MSTRLPSRSFLRGHKFISRLIGNGFQPIKTKATPVEIHAAPKIICPQCSTLLVLPELRHITNGRCWSCYLKD